MGERKWKLYLDFATSCLVLIAAVAIVAVFAKGYLTAPKENKPTDDSLKVGTKIASLKETAFADSDRTIVIFLSTQCRYCIASVPFYKKLAETQGRSRGKNVSVVAVFSNSDEETEKFLGSKSLSLKSVSAADFKELKVSMTPSIALIDRTGKILDSWTGQLTPASEARVMEILQ